MKPATARSLGTLCCAALFWCLITVVAQAELAVPLDGNQTIGNANSATAKQAQTQQKALQQSGAARSAGGTFSKNLNFTTSNTVKGNINAANSAQVNIGGLDLGGSAAASSGGNGQSAVSTAATAAAALINQPSQSNGNTSTSSASVIGNAGKTTAATPSGGTSASNSGQQSQTGNAQSAVSQNSTIKGAEDAIKWALGPKGQAAFDPGMCMNFVWQAYKQAGVDLNKNGHTGTAKEYADFRGPLNDPGDPSAIPPRGAIVFFDYVATSGKNKGKNLGHIGISLGDGTFINPSSVSGLTTSKLNSSYYKTVYLGWCYP